MLEKQEDRKDNSKLIDAIEVELLTVLGKSLMTVKEVREISVGSVIPLDKDVDDLVDIYVNNKLIAKGELISEEEKSLSVKIAEIIDN